MNIRPTAAEIQELQESLDVVDLHPGLQPVVAQTGLNEELLTVAMRMKGDKLDMSAREQVFIADESSKLAVWEVPSLRALFRGDKQPPSMQPQPPLYYLPVFNFVEMHIPDFCEAFGEPTDSEFRDAFSNLRRRPDGKSLNPLHFYLWQVAAGLLGIRPISAAEFEAIFTRLTQSASTFRIGLVSRNYAQVTRGRTFRVTKGGSGVRPRHDS